MKRIVFLLLTVLLVITMGACSPSSGNANAEVITELEKSLGEIDKLPVDIDEAVDQVGKEATQYRSSSTDDEIKELLAVFDDSVLYFTSRTEHDKTDEGIAFGYTITALHIGQSKLSDDNSLEVKFAAAHLQMSIVSDDVRAAKKYLKELMDDAPVDADAARSYNDLIDGEQIYVTSDSALWDEFVEVDEDMTIVCDSNSGTFEVKFVGEVGKLYHNKILDGNDRVIKDVAYYYDENGNRWLESVEENSYTDEGALIKTTYYYPNSDQISKYSEKINMLDPNSTGSEITYKLTEELEYYENGTLKREYHNLSESQDEERYIIKEYAEDGSMTGESCCNDEGTYRIAYENGVKRYYYLSTGGTTLIEFYYPNGNLESSDEFIGDEFDGKIVRSESGYENGNLKRVNEYYDSGNIRFDYWYFEDTGTLESVTEFYDMEGEMRKEYISYGGKWYAESCSYYPSGQMSKQTTWYTEDQLRSLEEWYENGQVSKSCEYDTDGNVTLCTEYYENGSEKYSYEIRAWGDIVEAEWYENGQLKIYHVWFATGEERVDEYYENGADKRYYYRSADGFVDETLYDENGNRIVQ